MSALTPVLIVAYAFPPRGGVAVRRVLSWVAAFPALGLRPIVLTVHPAQGTVQADATLLERLPPEAIVVRTTSLEPYRLYRALGGSRAQDDPRHRATQVAAGGGESERSGLDALYAHLTDRFCVPDPKISWFPLALEAARAIRAEFQPALVLATGPPASSFVIGGAIARQWGVPLVLDYRDPWTTGYYPLDRPAAVQEREVALERRLLDQAAAVSTVSADFAGKLVQLKSDLADKMQVIPNGIELDSLANLDPLPFERPTLVHTGSLYHQRSPAPLFQALADLRQEQPDLVDAFDLRLYGNVDPAYLAQDSTLGLTQVVSEGFVEHRTALQAQAGAALLFLVTEGMLTAKVYEYLAAERPILAIGEAPELDALLQEWGAGRCFHPTDVAGIRAHLSELLPILRAHPAGQRIVLKRPLAALDARTRASEMATLLKAVMAGTAPYTARFDA